jgi:hypothetical protein
MTQTLIQANLTDPFNAFFAYIRAAKQQQIDRAILEAKHQEKLDRLDFRMEQLTEIASEGMEENLSRLLSTQLLDWAKKEALETLLLYGYGQVDPDDRGLQQAFWQKLNSQHQDLSSELLLLLQWGKKQREQAEREYAHSWEAVAKQAIENQQQQFQNAAMQWTQSQQQWFQHQQQMFVQSQQSNQQWANVALSGVQQAQAGVQNWYEFASKTQQNVANMLAGTDQRQATVIADAVRKANMKKWTLRLVITGLVMAGLIGVLAFAFYAMMHLY